MGWIGLPEEPRHGEEKIACGAKRRFLSIPTSLALIGARFIFISDK